MSKLPYESHYLAITALVEGRPLNGRNGYDEFKCARMSNIISDFRHIDGLLIDEKAIARSSYSHFKPYRLIQSLENLQRAKEIQEKYKSLLGARQYKKAA
jgi:hypothetical protein